MKRVLLIPGILLLLLTLLFFFFYERDLTYEEARAILADEESRYLAVDGMQVHYKREGQGFPIVLVHGTGAILQTWDAWTKTLTSNGYEVIRMDLQSFGLTGPREDDDYAIESYVDFLDQFIEKLGVDSFHLAGNSLGGNIAWHYAIEHQDKIGKMILIAPSGFKAKKRKGSIAFKLAKYAWLEPVIKNLGTRLMVRRTMKDVYYDDSKLSETLYEQYLAATKRAGNRGAFIKRVNAEQNADTSALASIKTPTLLMWGDHDVLVPHTLAEKFQNAMANDTLILYTNMGHIPMEEMPERSVRDAMYFLNQ
jgi:pimeloyl-ACP methyl ester carboxylesterase